MSDSERLQAAAMAAKVDVVPGGNDLATLKRSMAWMLAQAWNYAGSVSSGRGGGGRGLLAEGVSHWVFGY